LTYAAESGWDGFTCLQCVSGIDKTLEQMREEAHGIVVAFSKRGKPSS
jgi:hypothetical protein